MVFLEYQACPFTRGGKGWLFGSWVVFQETSPEGGVELTIAKIAALNAAGRPAHALTTCDKSRLSLP
jgi:hypothetical protein